MGNRIHKVSRVAFDQAIYGVHPRSNLARRGSRAWHVGAAPAAVRREPPKPNAEDQLETSPSQKIGMTQIIVPNIRTARSTGLSRCAPANTPSGIPTKDATSMPPIAISTVAGKRPEIKLQTDWPV